MGFRGYRIGMIADVTKAYFSMATGELEKNVRRVIWRFGKNSKNWKVFGFMVVSMGIRIDTNIENYPSDLLPLYPCTLYPCTRVFKMRSG